MFPISSMPSPKVSVVREDGEFFEFWENALVPILFTLPGMFSVVRWCARKACCPISVTVSGITSISIGVLRKAILPMEVTPSGIRTSFSAVVLNTDRSMVVRFLDNTNVSRDAQFVNAPAATDVTLSGITNSVNAVARNAALPMDCKVSGNLMAVIELVANALAPMAVTSCPSGVRSGIRTFWSASSLASPASEKPVMVVPS